MKRVIVSNSSILLPPDPLIDYTHLTLPHSKRALSLLLSSSHAYIFLMKLPWSRDDVLISALRRGLPIVCVRDASVKHLGDWYSLAFQEARGSVSFKSEKDFIRSLGEPLVLGNDPKSLISVGLGEDFTRRLEEPLVFKNDPESLISLKSEEDFIRSLGEPLVLENDPKSLDSLRKRVYEAVGLEWTSMGEFEGVEDPDVLLVGHEGLCGVLLEELILVGVRGEVLGCKEEVEFRVKDAKRAVIAVVRKKGFEEKRLVLAVRTAKQLNLKVVWVCEQDLSRDNHLVARTKAETSRDDFGNNTFRARMTAADSKKNVPAKIAKSQLELDNEEFFGIAPTPEYMAWDGGDLGREARALGLDDMAMMFAEGKPIEFSLNIRSRKDKIDQAISKIAHACGLPVIINVPVSLNPYRVALEASRNYTPTSRDWVVDEIYFSFSNEQDRGKNAHACVIMAEGGMGKTTVLGELCRRANRIVAKMKGGEPDYPFEVAAMHFFSQVHVVNRSVETALRSIARQLCAAIPGFRKYLPLNRDAMDEFIKNSIANSVFGPAELINALIIKPALAVRRPRSAEKMMILLDAIDECEAFEELSSAIETYWPGAPNWLTLILSLRPFHQNPWTPGGSFQPEIIHIVNDQANQDDLSRMISAQFQNQFAVQPTPGLLKAVFGRAAGSHLWLKLHEQKFKTLADREELTVESVSKLAKGLNETYKSSFMEILNLADKDVMQYHIVVGTAFLIPRAPLPLKIWKSLVQRTCRNFETDTQWAKLEHILRELLAISLDEKYVFAYHRTMADWLTGGASGGQNSATKQLLFDATQLEDLHDYLGDELNRQYETMRVPRWSEADRLSPEGCFAVDHAVYHFTEAKTYEKAREWFVEFQNLYWMVASRVYQTQSVDQVVDDGRKLLESAATLSFDARGIRLAVQVVAFSAIALVSDPRQLAAQFIGRLPPSDGAVINEMNRRSTAIATLSFVAKSMRNSLTISNDGSRRGSFRGGGDGGGSDANDGSCVSGSGAGSVTSSITNAARRLSSGLNTSKTKLPSMERSFDAASSIASSMNSSRKSVFGVKGATMIEDDFDENISDELRQGAKRWVVEARELGNLIVCSPNSFFSGLQWAGEPLLRVVDYPCSVLAVCMFTDVGTGRKRGVSGLMNGSTRMWDVDSGVTFHIFEGHTNAVEAVAVSSDSKHLVTGAKDKTIRLWDINTGMLIRSVVVLFRVRSVALSYPDGKFCAVASDDKDIRIFDLLDKHRTDPIRVLSGHAKEVRCVTFSMFGVSGIPFDHQLLVSGSTDKTARVWDMTNSKPLKVLTGHTDSIWSVALSQFAKICVTASNDKTARVWDIEAGSTLRILIGHSNWVYSTSISTDGKRCLTGSFDCTVRLWDTQTGETLRTLMGHKKEIMSVSMDSDGKRAVSASSDNQAFVWDLHSRKYVPKSAHSDEVVAVNICTNATRCITGSADKTARLWSLATGENLKILNVGTGTVFAVSLNTDGTRAATCSDDGVRVWDCDSGKALRHFRGQFNFVSLAADGLICFAKTLDGHAKAWDCELGRELAQIDMSVFLDPKPAIQDERNPKLLVEGDVNCCLDQVPTQVDLLQDRTLCGKLGQTFFLWEVL